MSILQYPETATTTQLQVWNNAAFDGEELQGFSFPMKASWSSLHSSESLRSDCSKENLSPAALNSTPVPSKPLRSTAKKKNKGFDEREDEKKIDDEIQEIENEIKRLSSRLEALRLQKAASAAAAAAAKTAERRGRIVPAKFMELKQSAAVKIIEETPKAKVGGVMRRGVSLGPAEISAGGGRFSSRPPGKVNAVNAITPVPATQSRRKSCFWKLDDVDELKGVCGRKKTLSLSPKSKRNVGRVDSVQGPKQAAATVTVGARRSVKKEDGVVALVQPRNLFKEGEKSVPNKRPVKPGRVVASRYNQIAGGNNNNSVAVDARKRSLPENDKDDEGGDGGKRWDKRRASLRGSGQGSKVRVKKRWEIPSQVAVCEKIEVEEEVVVAEEKPLVSLPSTAGVSGVLLRKIRTLRYPNESPRDSGAAKRVADLTGKRSYFCPDEDNQDMEASLCQVLSFAEDDDADEEF